MAFIDLSEFKRAPRKAAVRKFAGGTTNAVDVENRTATFCISDESPDRDGDVIAVKGWDTSNYERNPVLLFAHDASELPIGKALRIWSESGKLMGQFKFADHQRATDVFNLVADGMLNATSVGFMPRKYAMNEDRPGTYGMPGVDFIETELLEVSVVPVPANPNALLDGKAFKAMEKIMTVSKSSPPKPDSQDAQNTPDQDDGPGNNAEELHKQLGEHVKAMAAYCAEMGQHCKDLADHKAAASAHSDQLAIHAAEAAKNVAKTEQLHKQAADIVKELKSVKPPAPNPDADEPNAANDKDVDPITAFLADFEAKKEQGPAPTLDLSDLKSLVVEEVRKEQRRRQGKLD